MKTAIEDFPASESVSRLRAAGVITAATSVTIVAFGDQNPSTSPSRIAGFRTAAAGPSSFARVAAGVGSFGFMRAGFRVGGVLGRGAFVRGLS